MTRGPLRVPLAGLSAGPRELDPAAAHYVCRVHRLHSGDKVVVFDPQAGLEAAAELRVSGRRAWVELAVPRPGRLAGPAAPTLIQALGKGGTIDAIVRDATELGAARIVVAVAARSVRRPSPSLAKRLAAVALEAARQCGRGDVPVLDVGIPLAEAFPRYAPGSAGQGICLHPAAATPFQALRLEPGRSLVVAVGPEGGFEAAELGTASANDYALVTLGALTLRTETVCAAVLGALLLTTSSAPLSASGSSGDPP